MNKNKIEIKGNSQLSEKGDSLESICLYVYKKLQEKTEYQIENVEISFKVGEVKIKDLVNEKK